MVKSIKKYFMYDVVKWIVETYSDINKTPIINIQSGLDDGISRYDLLGWKPSVVDMGSGRCFQEGQEGP